MTANLVMVAGCLAAVSIPVLTRMVVQIGVHENRSTLELTLVALFALAVYATVERWTLRDRHHEQSSSNGQASPESADQPANPQSRSAA
jgi:DNA polymerase III psi subunit